MFACTPVAKLNLGALHVDSVHRRSAAVLGCTESVAESPRLCTELQVAHALRKATAKNLHDVALTPELTRAAKRHRVE